MVTYSLNVKHPLIGDYAEQSQVSVVLIHLKL